MCMYHTEPTVQINCFRIYLNVKCFAVYFSCNLTLNTNTNNSRLIKVIIIINDYNIPRRSALVSAGIKTRYRIGNDPTCYTSCLFCLNIVLLSSYSTCPPPSPLNLLPLIFGSFLLFRPFYLPPSSHPPLFLPAVSPPPVDSALTLIFFRQQLFAFYQFPLSRSETIFCSVSLYEPGVSLEFCVCSSLRLGDRRVISLPVGFCCRVNCVFVPINLIKSLIAFANHPVSSCCCLLLPLISEITGPLLKHRATDNNAVCMCV